MKYKALRFLSFVTLQQQQKKNALSQHSKTKAFFFFFGLLLKGLKTEMLYILY